MNQSAEPNEPDGAPEPALDARPDLETMPLTEASTEETPPMGVEEVPRGGADLVETAYAPLTEQYEHLQTLLQDDALGWAAQIAALRALRTAQVAGDWEVLARLLVAPGTLDATGAVRLVRTADEPETVRHLVADLKAAGERTLLLAPTPEKAAELLQAVQDDPEIRALLIETHPPRPPAASDETLKPPPAQDEPPATPSRNEAGSNGTVEFKPVTGLPAPGTAVTRAEPLPAAADDDVQPAAEPRETSPTDWYAQPITPETPAPAGPTKPNEPTPSDASAETQAIPAVAEADEGAKPEVSEALLSSGAPETWVMGAGLRAVGEGWARRWRAEAGKLRRGLMLLDQWPLDAAALTAVRAEVAARKEALDAELAGLAGAIEEARDAAQSAEERAAEADAEAQRLVAVQREAEDELIGPRAEAERLQGIADAAGAEASDLTRMADEAYARCTQLDQRAREAQEEFRGAQQVEASLKDELARAQEALPAAAEEADRLAAVDADASAEGHAAYYRLVSAESALAAVRRKMTLTQRLHVAAPPSDLKSVRAEVQARTRDADVAAKRAQEAKDAAERAEAHRQGLAAFVAEGGPRLATAREAQERLTTELAWLATERETATADHREQARRAAESVDRATQAGLEARAAQQAARAVEERVEAARAGREAALAAAAQARADSEAAVTRAAELRAELDRRSAQGEEETAAGQAELQAAEETEARARENVQKVFEADPADDPDVIGERRRSAMARIEELGGFLEGGGPDGAALLPAADLVVGTPVGVGAAVPDERFGALVAVGPLDDADFLVGAVRTARWILVGPPEDEQPGHGTFARCATAAPRLVENGDNLWLDEPTRLV
ncbi:hypothetical protein F8568_042050 [Actinomadura sp. LD22]|uniref:Uncharacterized protein n=1 Tax=Actinomadura physcomitrii TaxID=2650748 RepID=A0A6I4MVX9_9ACTN|nr:hypothetical protein [Actinomadura physcomitrii]MWA06819.1 hypothetical protein [Actinomadura physcomitrii]